MSPRRRNFSRSKLKRRMTETTSARISRADAIGREGNLRKGLVSGMGGNKFVSRNRSCAGGYAHTHTRN